MVMEFMNIGQIEIKILIQTIGARFSKSGYIGAEVDIRIGDFTQIIIEMRTAHMITIQMILHLMV